MIWQYIWIQQLYLFVEMKTKPRWFRSKSPVHQSVYVSKSHDHGWRFWGLRSEVRRGRGQIESAEPIRLDLLVWGRKKLNNMIFVKINWQKWRQNLLWVLQCNKKCVVVLCLSALMCYSFVFKMKLLTLDFTICMALYMFNFNNNAIASSFTHEKVTDQMFS